jgi:hypothetical protein
MPRLAWSQTFPHTPNDYVATAPGVQGNIGRIYRYDGGPQDGSWFWTMHAHLLPCVSGSARTRNAAAIQVARAWERALLRAI